MKKILQATLTTISLLAITSSVWAVAEVAEAPNTDQLFGESVSFDCFHLSPGCKHDLAAGKPELVNQLANAYDQWWEKTYPEMIVAGGDKSLTDQSPKTKK